MVSLVGLECDSSFVLNDNCLGRDKEQDGGGGCGAEFAEKASEEVSPGCSDRPPGHLHNHRQVLMFLYVAICVQVDTN